MYSWCYTCRSKVWTLGGLVPPMTASDVFSAAPFFPAMQSGYLGTLLKTIVPAITSSKLCWIFWWAPFIECLSNGSYSIYLHINMLSMLLELSVGGGVWLPPSPPPEVCNCASSKKIAEMSYLVNNQTSRRSALIWNCVPYNILTRFHFLKGPQRLPL